MSRKQKGIGAERELLHMFWKHGWACIRVAGSGSSHYPSPDLVAGNKTRKLVIECKSTKNQIKYLSQEEIAQLKEFAVKFGAEPWIGVRFNILKWYFLSLDDLKTDRQMFAVSLTLAKAKGLLFEELIGKFG